jgi:hypothetical protein
MEKIASSFVSDYEFIKDANNDIVSAAYPMKQHLIKENNKRMILGGSIDTGMTRFDDLGIPVGLYLENHFSSLNQSEIQAKHYKFEVMGDELFDKLFHSVSTVKPHSTTKKNIKFNKKSKTKKYKPTN